MKLENVAEYLREQGYGTIGIDLFAHRMPEEVNVGVLLTSPLTGVMIDHEMPGYYKSNFLMVIRHREIDTGLSLAETLSNVLSLQEQKLGDVVVNFIRPRFKPVVFPSSQGDNFEASVGFDASYYVL